MSTYIKNIEKINKKYLKTYDKSPLKIPVSF